jgi:predicted hotdog family 3-hydroxylacyl-ACP dehydratase
MIARGTEIVNYIPQRPPMVMIDKILSANDGTTRSGFTVTAECIFVDKGVFTESGLVENMAQTAAAGVGYSCKKENKPVPIGFIASIKNLQVLQLPPLGTELETEVSIVNEVLDITIVNAKVYHANTVFAQCEMRIFIQPSNT